MDLHQQHHAHHCPHPTRGPSNDIIGKNQSGNTLSKDQSNAYEPLHSKSSIAERRSFLLELYKEYESEKGKNMWRLITNAYNQRFGSNIKPKMLLKRMCRTKSKLGKRPEREV